MIAPGPELISVYDSISDGSVTTVSRVTRPPKEWPTRWTGSPTASITAVMSAPSSAQVYAVASSGPGSLVLAAHVERDHTAPRAREASAGPR